MPPVTWDWGALFWHVAQVVVYVIPSAWGCPGWRPVIDKATPFSPGQVSYRRRTTSPWPSSRGGRHPGHRFHHPRCRDPRVADEPHPDPVPERPHHWHATPGSPRATGRDILSSFRPRRLRHPVLAHHRLTCRPSASGARKKPGSQASSTTDWPPSRPGRTPSRRPRWRLRPVPAPPTSAPRPAPRVAPPCPSLYGTVFTVGTPCRPRSCRHVVHVRDQLLTSQRPETSARP
jgi:hypothetical protein